MNVDCGESQTGPVKQRTGVNKERKDMMKKISTMRQQLRLVAALCILVCLCGCTTTHQVSRVQTSGFLGDYSQLRKGGTDEAQLVYINPAADWSKYKKIMMDPIVLYTATERSKVSRLPRQEIQALLNYLDARLRQELGKDYQFVTAPGDDVMRLRVALTEARGRKVLLNTVSTVMPIGLAISTAQRVTLGTHTGVGQTNVEAEIVDSRSSECLMAAVDARAGRKVVLPILDTFNRTRDVTNAFDYWAGRTRERLAGLVTR
jgi:hypothetical protein